MLVLICVASVGQHGLMLTGSPDFCTTMIRGTDFKIFGNVAIKRINCFHLQRDGSNDQHKRIILCIPVGGKDHSH